MSKWIVISPEYTYYEGPSAYLPDDVRPSEPCSNVECIEAETRQQAKVLFIREIRRREAKGEQTYLGWKSDNPFSGLKVEKWDSNEEW